jgi:hypothetical protein
MRDTDTDLLNARIDNYQLRKTLLDMKMWRATDKERDQLETEKMNLRLEVILKMKNELPKKKGTINVIPNHQRRMRRTIGTYLINDLPTKST